MHIIPKSKYSTCKFSEDASPYCGIATSTKSSTGERERETHRHAVSASHFTLFQPSGWTAVSLHSHRWPPHCHVTVQRPIWAHCYLWHGWHFGVSVGTKCQWTLVFSDLQVKGCLVQAKRVKTQIAGTTCTVDYRWCFILNTGLPSITFSATSSRLTGRTRSIRTLSPFSALFRRV